LSNDRSVKKQKSIKTIGIYLILFLFSFWTVFPLWHIFKLSVGQADLNFTTDLSFFPSAWSLKSYRNIFIEVPFLQWIGNSLLVSSTVTLTGLSLASFAGYGFSRFKFKWRKSLLFGMIATQMFPVTLILLPLFVLLVKLNLNDTFFALSIGYSALVLPFCIWQMKTYYDTVPRSMEEAAWIDGSSHWVTFYRIVLPQITPALVVVGLFSFISAWGEIMMASVIIQNPDLYTLPLGLKSIQTGSPDDIGLFAAGSVIVTVPVVILFILLNRVLISGFTPGGFYSFRVSTGKD